MFSFVFFPDVDPYDLPAADLDLYHDGRAADLAIHHQPLFAAGRVHYKRVVLAAVGTRKVFVMFQGHNLIILPWPWPRQGRGLGRFIS